MVSAAKFKTGYTVQLWIEELATSHECLNIYIVELKDLHKPDMVMEWTLRGNGVCESAPAQSLIGKSSQSVSVKSSFSGHIWAGVYSGYKWQWYLQICWGLYFWTLMGLQLQGIRLREFAQFLYCCFNASPVRPSTTTWTTILSYQWLRCEAVTADQFGPTGLFLF